MGQPTLAAFKRRIREGVIIDAVGHYNAKASGLRVVTKVQGNGFWWTNDNLPQRSWTEWPKAKHCRIVDEDTITILFEDGREVSTLKIVQDVEAVAN